MLDRKIQILDTAAELLQSRSFSSFSYQDLADRLGVTKANIHHHFKKKEDLGIALIEHYLLETRASLENISQNNSNPWDQIEGYIRFMSDYMVSGNKICPPGVLQTEYNVIPEAMRQGIGNMVRYIVKWLANVLSSGRDEGCMDFPGNPEDQAELIHAAMQGALQNARALGPKKFTAVARQLKDGMKVK